MEIENQVVNLEIAKELNEKLKSVNMVVDSVFYWVDTYGRDGVYPKIVDFKPRQTFYPSAYTLTEMLEMLPKQIPYPRKMSHIEECFLENSIVYQRRIDPYEVLYFSYKHGELKHFNYNEKVNPATAAAKLMIWLIDNGHVKGDKS